MDLSGGPGGGWGGCGVGGGSVGELEGMLVMTRLNVGEESELAARLADTHPDMGKPYFGRGKGQEDPTYCRITCLFNLLFEPGEGWRS